MQLQGLTVQKRSSAILEFVNLYSDSGTQSPLFITNYATINVLDEISRIPGVGQANLFSRLKYSMRIWFDTNRLTELKLSPTDIINAINAQNVVAPIGRIGARPRRVGRAVPVQPADPGAPDHPRAVRQPSWCAPTPTVPRCA
ncbi:MAG: efflux RND transporter permease subunit [Acetobacteraceae bacterium]